MNSNKMRAIILSAVLIIINICVFVFIYPYDEFPETFVEAKNGVVCIATNEGQGSGFAIGESGEPVSFIVTNYHVVFDEDGEKASNVNVYFSAAANRYVSAQIYRYDAEKDIAVLRLPEPTTEVTPLKIRKNVDVDINTTHYSLGFPGRAAVNNDYLKYDKSDIVTTSGLISKQTMIGERDVYMLDLQITSGNSGGPLVNEAGEVVGINTFSITDLSDDTSYYAVCIDELLRIIDVEEVPYTTTEDVNVFGIVVIGVDIVISGIILAIVVFLFVNKNKEKIVASVKENRTVNSEMREKSSDISKTVAVVNTMPALKCVAGALKNEEFVVETELYIGRDPKRCDIVLPVDAEGVSGYHCMVKNQNGMLVIVDKGSTYGTFINKGLKVSVETPVELSDGDSFYLGSENTKFIVTRR